MIRPEVRDLARAARETIQRDIDRAVLAVADLDGSPGAYERAVDCLYGIGGNIYTLSLDFFQDHPEVVPMIHVLYTADEATNGHVRKFLRLLLHVNRVDLALSHPLLPILMAADQDEVLSVWSTHDFLNAYLRTLTDAFAKAHFESEQQIFQGDFHRYFAGYVVDLPDGVSLQAKSIACAKSVSLMKSISRIDLEVLSEDIARNWSMYMLLRTIRHWESRRGPSVLRPKRRSPKPVVVPVWQYLADVNSFLGELP